MTHRPTTGMTAPALLAALLFVSLLAGCDGNPGTNGTDAPEYDHIPPTVTLLRPTTSTFLGGDTLTLQADAVDEGGAVARVRFFVNGVDSLGGVPAEDSTAPYSFLWNFATSGTPYGLVSFSATAWDTAGNALSTPLLLLRRELITGVDTLAYYSDGLGNDKSYAIADSLPLYDTNGDSIGRTIRDRLGTRFTTRGPGQLLSIGFTFPTVSGFARPSTLWILLYKTGASFSDLIPLDSLSIPFDISSQDHWLDLDMTGWNGGEGYTFGAGESFVAAVRLTPSDQAAHLIQAFVTTRISNNPSSRPAEERGVVHREEGGWGTLSEVDPEGHVFLPWMRAVLDYGAGAR